MIRYTKGDLFEAQTDAVINTVNTVGVMGKGIALQFKKRFPQNFKIYKKACDEGSFEVGDLLITQSDSLFFKYIINFPTKKHWRNPSEYEYVEEGLKTLLVKIPELGITSVAVPPLGAGNGKLDWQKVKVLLEQYLSQLPEVEFIVYEPQPHFDQRDHKAQPTAKLTPTRALLLDAFAHYQKVDSSLNLLVTQKIAYFLQRLGEPLRLQYAKGWYGPYAANLNKVLQVMNGAYLSYQSQYDKPATSVKIKQEKMAEVTLELEKLKPIQKERLASLKKFIEGFETPFSLELLATVDWILQNNPSMEEEEIHKEIGNWTRRKSILIKPFHVKVAYNHLKQWQPKFAATTK